MVYAALALLAGQVASPSWFRSAPPLPGRRVLAHHFPTFPLAYDDRPAAHDYYETQYLRPEGESGKFAAVGGMIRERPTASPWVGKGFADWRVRNFDEEVRRAQAAGLDGFTMDLWDKPDSVIQGARLLMDAAARAKPAFSVVLMPDMAILGGRPEGMLEIVRALGHHPAVARDAEGRLILSPYLADRQPPEWWRANLAKLQGEGFRIAFLPTFQGESHVARYAGLGAIGHLNWSGAATEGDGLRVSSAYPQYFRPNVRVVQPTLGSVDYRRMWQAGMDARSDWMHVVTWNDYSEATEIAPSTGIGTSFSQLTAYYAAWFRAGQPPRIVRDTAMAFYRPFLAPKPGEPGADWGNANRLPEDVEVLTFLTAPATVRLVVGGRRVEHETPAGMASWTVPAVAGRLRIEVVRDGRTVVDLRPESAIAPAGPRPNFLTVGAVASAR